MQTIENMYDNLIADNYDLDQFQLFSNSHQTAFSQINKNISQGNVETILDMACGTGQMLVQLRDIFPEANFLGIDISEKMLAIAQGKMKITTFHDDAKNIGKYVESNSVDLILLHFLLAYISPEIIIMEASRLLKNGGLCSLATSTYESFQTLQMLASSFLSEEELYQAQVPKNPEALNSLLNDAGFKIIENDILKKKVTFFNFQELYNWSIKSGWFTQYIEKISPQIIEIMSAQKDIFPLEDEFQANIILAQKV
jgi:ubiquinone/menaquinone biosynthesis C-methylase UbiE